MLKERKERSCNLDIIRIFAFLCVVSVHFFMNSKFYKLDVDGAAMIFPICLRNFFMICVPLFLLLSGYLMKDKTPCKAYYAKMIRILGIYLLSSIACAVYKWFFDRGNFHTMSSIAGLFSFETAGYSWYVEMYIGLFMMIPYLNKMYRGGTQRSKRLLLLTFLIITALPSMANIWRFSDPSWWRRPRELQEYHAFAPDYWLLMYPITFYLIGCYLREYPLKLKPMTGLLLLLAVSGVSGVFTYYRAYGGVFFGGSWSSYQSVFVTIQSVLVFHILNSLNLSFLGEKGKRLIRHLSLWTLGAYLCSEIFDGIFYKVLNAAEPTILRRLLYAPVIVPAVAICSLLLSGILDLIYVQWEKLVKKCFAPRNTTQKP